MMLTVPKILNHILRNSTFLFCIINNAFIFVPCLFNDFHSLPLNPPIHVLDFNVCYFVAVASRRPSASIWAFILLISYW